MAVKSFQGVRENISSKKASTLSVEDVMTKNLVVFSPEDSIFEVMRKFIRHKISGGPVVNKRGAII